MKSQHLANRCAAVTALCMVAFVWTSSARALAQTSSDFAALQKHINKEVTVDTPEGPVKGQLVRVDEARIVIYDAGKPKPISRESVRSVTKHNSRHTAAWVAGMSAAGLGAGFLLGLRAFDDATNANGKIGGAAAGGAGAGAAAGYALSRVGKRDEVVYRTEQ